MNNANRFNQAQPVVMPLDIYLSRNVRPPSYGTPGSGCLDFYVPEFDEQFLESLALKNSWLSIANIALIKEMQVIRVNSLSDLCVPSGVYARLAPGTALRAMNKSGIATKLKLIKGAEYIDSDYMGESNLHVINVSKEIVNIIPGMKLVQFEYGPVYKADIRIMNSKDELYDGFNSERGEGWQGSTGIK